MPVRKRKDSPVYFIDLRKPDGSRVRRSAGTTNRKEAQEYHDKLKHELWRALKRGEKPLHTFDDAALRYLKEQTRKADYETKVGHVRHFRAALGGHRLLDTLTRDEIMAALPDQDRRTTRAKALSNATRNRYLATIRAMLNDAAGEWEWMDRAPKLEDLPESGKRVRWITRDEAQRLLRAINTDWMRDVTVFGLATGLRQANILELEWSQVDLVKRRAWVHPDQAKARKAIGIPLNQDAVEVIRRQLGKHERFVFVRNGDPIECWDVHQWQAACKRAGIENFRFHDVRHTWASWHVQNGTPLNRLMELGGWSSYEMVLRYSHLAPEHLAEFAGNSLLNEPPASRSARKEDS
jgi:integrase